MILDPVLAAYPSEPARRSWEPVGGGFSGASVWKGISSDGSAVALKRWPADYSADRLRTVHGWVAAVAHLPFVPRILSTRTGDTVVTIDGAHWDLATWLPGEPDRHPSDTRLAAACTTLAELHRTWFSSILPGEPGDVTPPGEPTGIGSFTRGTNVPRLTNFVVAGSGDPATARGIPAIHRRLALFRSYRAWQAAGGRPSVTGHARLNRKCAAAFTLLPTVIPDLERALAPWRDRPLPIGPCLCDVHAGHVLFTGDAVTGVIDYGAMKLDHPAVDLARYLGAAVTADARAFAVGLAAYRAARPPVEVPDELVYLLELSGAAGGLATWLLRLAAGHPVDDPQNVARRMKRMLARLRLEFPSGLAGED
jgi:homoserine kinase type II